MNQKAIFLDIDGTLLNHKGEIPQSARQAITKARANGHAIFICTGRSKAEIPPEVLALELDGIIGAAGGYIELKGKVIFEVYIPKDQLFPIIDFFEKKRVKYYLEATKKVYVNKESKAYLIANMIEGIKKHPERKEEIERMMYPYMMHMQEEENLIREDINKVTFMGTHISFEEIKKTFRDNFQVIPGSYSHEGEVCGELMLKEVHKAAGIELVLKELGIAQQDTFAYGDSYNDIEMLQYVAYGIAMANGAELIKQVADDLTDGPDEDGLYKSFKKYKLIDNKLE